MARARKKKKGPRGRLASLAVFLIAAGVVLYGRGDLLWGFKGYILGRIDFVRIEKESDLPSAWAGSEAPAEVEGIPDYKNVLRFPHTGKSLACFRMVGFGNRLVVCSDEGLKPPQAIDEIIKERRIRGRLERLGRSPMDDRLRTLFRQQGDIQVREDAFLLSEDEAPLPSPVGLGVFVFCLVVCCLSAYRLIK
jgi:hypothetical protein